MVGIPGQQSKNQTGAGLKAISSLQVHQWPWQKKNAKMETWTEDRIFRHLAKTLEKWGLTRDRSSADLVSHLATHHWLCMVSKDAIRRGDNLLGKNPYAQLTTSLSGIKAAYTALGAWPYTSVREWEGDEDSVIDFS